MSDFGMFEADEATQAEPRLAAKTAGRKMEAAIDAVRKDFGSFLLGATGIDEFGDRWHYSKHDIRKAVEPYVFPNTGTMRRVMNAMKSDWKLAHPYKLAEGGGSNDSYSGGSTNPSGGIGSYGGPGGAPAMSGSPADTSIVGPGIGSGAMSGGYESFNGDSSAPAYSGGDPGGEYLGVPGQPGFKGASRRRQALSHEEAGFGQMETQNTRHNQDLDETYHPSSGNLIPQDNFKGWKDSVDQDGPEKVESHAFTPGGDSGSDHREAARLVADIYTDFAQANGLRVASLDTLDAYASTGIAESDYRLLESMIVRTAEDCDDEESEDADDEDTESEDSEGDAPDFGGSEGGDAEDDDEEEYDFGDEDDDGDHDDDDHHDSGGDEEYDFGDADEDGDHDDEDHHDGGEAGGQQFTVPDQAPELDPQMMQEIPQGDTDGSAPIPPEVIDSLLGLPEGTIEQLLLEEVEQGAQGGGDQFGGAPQGGGDDFLGEVGGDNTQPPRMARRRRRLARPDESESAMMGRQRQQQRDSMDTKFGPRQETSKPNIQDLYKRAKNGDPEAYAQLRGLWNQRGWTASKAARTFWAAPDESEQVARERQDRQYREHLDNLLRQVDSQGEGRMHSDREDQGPQVLHSSKSARSFWAAEGDQEQADAGGEQAAPAQDPAAGGMDPAAMAQAGGGMMPPPGSQAVAPPQQPQPMEDQPAEDALLDTANQAIMQMIDRETQEYQQIIDPLSQALQAIQFAQQVEQAEHPMDVTPPEGTVNVDPSQAPGGQPPMQQQAMRRSAADTRDYFGFGDPDEDEVRREEQFKELNPHLERRVLGPGRDAVFDPNNPDRRRQDKELNENNRRIEHQRALDKREAKKVGALKNAARLIAGRYGLSHGGERMLIQAMGRRNYEHVREALQLLPPDHLQAPQYRAAVRHIGEMFAAENPRFNRDVWMKSVLGSATGSRHPFDRPRLAGETWTHTPTMDAFEWENDQPRIDDNIAVNDLPKMVGASRADDAVSRFQRWTKWRQQNGLVVPGGEGGVHAWMQKTRNPAKPKVGPRASGEVHRSVGAEPDQAKLAPKPKVQKAVNPTLKKPKTAPKAPKAAGRTAKFVNEDGGYHTRDDDDPEHVFTNPRNGEKYVVQHKDGTLFRPGDTLTDFRGDTDVLKGISKYPDYNSEGKITVGDGFGPEYYPKNYDAKIVPYTADWDPDEGQDPFDPRLIGASWGEWEPPKTASFFTRRVPGWKWDDHLSGYISKEAKPFACSCGQKIAAPSYRTCDCGKVWNVYAIGDTHHLASDTADMYVAREIEVRPGVIMANRKMVGVLNWTNEGKGRHVATHPDGRQLVIEARPGFHGRGVVGYELWHVGEDAGPDEQKLISAHKRLSEAKEAAEKSPPDDARIKGANRRMAGDRFGEDVSPVYVVRTQNGERQYVADDATHAWEQHADAFGGQDGEEPLDVPHLHGMSDPDLGIELDQREANRKMAAPDRWFENEQEDLHRQRRQEEDDADAWAEKRMNTPHPDDEAYREANHKMAGTFDDFFEWGDEFNKKMRRDFHLGDDEDNYDSTKDPSSIEYQDPDLAEAYCADCEGELGDRGISKPMVYPHTGEKLCEGCMDSRIDEEMDIHVPKGWDPDGIDLGPDDPRIKGAARLFARLAGEGMSYEDAMSHIDDVLAEGEGHELHRYPGVPHDDGKYSDEYEDGESCDYCGGNPIRGPGDHLNMCQNPNRYNRRYADWTKYDDDVDPVAEAYGKSKIPSTKAPKIPRDWSRREPNGKWKNTDFAPKKK